jgi:hypothetical protein
MKNVLIGGLIGLTAVGGFALGSNINNTYEEPIVEPILVIEDNYIYVENEYTYRQLTIEDENVKLNKVNVEKVNSLDTFSNELSKTTNNVYEKCEPGDRTLHENANFVAVETKGILNTAVWSGGFEYNEHIAYPDEMMFNTAFNKEIHLGIVHKQFPEDYYTVNEQITMTLETPEETRYYGTYTQCMKDDPGFK